MTRVGETRGARVVAARTAAAAAVAMTVLTAVAAIPSGASFAAGGAQGEPTLVPASVEAQTDVFSLLPPTDVRCEEAGTNPGPRTGADNWRWHGFIVEQGRDLATLRFGPLGPGDDFDATDGSITAALLTAGGEGVWQRIPGLKPEGHINPDELAGLVLDPTVYTLRDGDYQIGFACTDGALATRQWWATTVTISTSTSPFMIAASAAAASSRTTAATAADATPEVAAPAIATGSTIPTGSTTTTGAATLAAATADGTQEPVPGSSTAVAAETPRVATDVSWSPLEAMRATAGLFPVGLWALLAVVFARTAYLLARPIRTRPVPAP
ncbi:MAG: hypothetical protein SGJ13_02205 [Actinomycetota bacterium]|nr:hypothetical protein [Actinomycetota bacterium]